MTHSLLRAENLSLSRGGRQVFARLSLTLKQGELWLVQGANGVGKSSLLKGLAGFLPFEKGAVTRPPCHYLGHENGVKNALTVHENLAFWRDYDEGQGDITAALTQMGLENLQALPARLLSQGQKRRLALAKLTLAHRPLWLLDEPQAGLDAAAQLRLETLMASHLATGGSVIMATHEAVRLPAQTLNLGDYTCSPS
jgi:heme exporter protein A